jgi:hypothetical protein
MRPLTTGETSGVEQEESKRGDFYYTTVVTLPRTMLKTCDEVSVFECFYALSHAFICIFYRIVLGT